MSPLALGEIRTHRSKRFVAAVDAVHAVEGLALQLALVVSFSPTIAGTSALQLLTGLAFCLPLAALVAVRPGVRRGAVTVSPGGVALDGVLVVPRAEITGGETGLARKGRRTVRLERGRLPPVDLVVRDDAEAASVLATLELAAPPVVCFQTAVGWPAAILSTAALLAVGAVFMRLARHGALSFWLVALCLSSMVALWALASAFHETVVVAADGVMRSRRFGRRRWLPMDRIQDVRIEGGALRFECAGRLSNLKIGSHRYEEKDAFAHRCATMAARLVAIRTRRARTAASPPPAVLPSPAANVEEDLRTLRRTRETTGYREVPVARDALWAVVEDPSAPPRTRVRAAVALRVSTEEAPRLRVAAESSANRDLSDALESVVADDDKRMMRHLAKLG